MRIRIPSILSQYTEGIKFVNIDAPTVIDALNRLDQIYPGIKFRFIDENNKVRPHMNLFLNKELIQDLGTHVSSDDELFIIQSLSGGIN